MHKKQTRKNISKTQILQPQLKWPMRINKYLAMRNFATRTGADVLVQKGKVTINGKKAILGDKVNEKDTVTVSELKNKKPLVYYAYNKQVGISTNPEVNCKDILTTTRFPQIVFPIGRLDKDSHGLIIMTNDGRVTDRLLSPKYVHEKEYIVKLEKEYTDKFLENMSSGVQFDGFTSAPCKIWPAQKAGSGKKSKIRDTFHIILTEGKKRQIRRMCEALYHKVTDLQRIRIMNIGLKDIKPGEYAEIKDSELDEFLKLLRLK